MCFVRGLTMQVAIVSDSVFEKIGYKDENGKTVLCCDSQAVEVGLGGLCEA